MVRFGVRKRHRGPILFLCILVKTILYKITFDSTFLIKAGGVYIVEYEPLYT